MTWQLFSPDLPFLQEMTIKQVHYGFWESIQPYLPLAAAVIAGTLSTIGIFVTCNLAKKARDISEEQKKIAECKLQLDSFDKRFYVFNSYKEFYTELISKNYDNEAKLLESYTKFHSIHQQSSFLFPTNISVALEDLWDTLHGITDFRVDKDKMTIEVLSLPDFKNFQNDFLRKYKTIREAFEHYVPSFLRE
ncbi:hypothetical protein [Acetobacter persici]|uniref:hypothetical protein n=1 Tax=Acetobacter persici TaxID=1076596 RepID=UPI0039ED4E09